MDTYHRESSNATHLWLSTLRRFVLAPPYQVASRLGRVGEVRAAHLTLRNPRQRWVWLPERRASIKLALVETLQLLAGITEPTMLTYLAPHNYTQALNPATGALDGAPGPRVAEQLPYVLRLLQQEPETRRAVISLYDQRDQRLSNDVPCATTLQFFRRGGELHLVNYMRSNDVWLGMPYDIFAFTTLQEMVAAILGDDLGTYTHIAGSLHLYERFSDIAEGIVSKPRLRGWAQAVEEGGRDRDIASLCALREGWPNTVFYGDIQQTAREVLNIWVDTRERECQYDTVPRPAPKTAHGPRVDSDTLQGLPPFFRVALYILTNHEEMPID